MAKATLEEAQQVREKLAPVLKKAATDEGFRKQLESKPVDTLKAAGIPDLAIGDLLKENNAKAEVTGLDYDVPCWVTCWNWTLAACAWSVVYR